MSAPKTEAPAPAAVETLERPDTGSVVVRFFKIDFDRCIIRQGSRVRPAGPRRRRHALR
ncbi:MAG: hypothetical protein HYV14_02050 [Elusimicrobia bacterium]|nr:hypothetical protein [Elusimicrobiota bacterium]